LNLWPTD